MPARAISTFFATIAAPIGPGLIAAQGTVVDPNKHGWLSNPMQMAGFFIVGYLIAFILVLLAGMPLFLIALNRGWAKWWVALIAGCVLGILFSLTLRLPAPPLLDDILVFSTYGVTTALTFWAVYKFIFYKIATSK